jgi:2-polyprenyl-3-methyl-5-hydroxy-6-metoxy-1,4-benzoquinol methylase
MELKENSSLNRYEWAAKKIEELTGDHLKAKNVTLYDIGSRDNILKKYITSPEVDYKAFDLEPLDASAEKWDIEQPFPYAHAPAQIVTMLEIIEHLKNPWLCMKNVFDTIAPGGFLILTTPNPAWSTSRLNLLKDGYLSCFTLSDLELNHHVFTAWPHIVKRMLNDTGFEIIEYSTLDGKTTIFGKGLTGFSIPLKLVSRMAKKTIESKDAASCGMSYGIIAKRIG